jgi:hypothetical protein
VDTLRGPECVPLLPAFLRILYDSGALGICNSVDYGEFFPLHPEACRRRDICACRRAEQESSSGEGGGREFIETAFSPAIE